jgi:stage III sporulation protein AB
MKLVGILLIIISTTLWGFNQARTYTLRPRQLQQLKTGLQLLQTEVSYGVTPLPRAFARLAAKLEEPIADFFSQARQGLNAGLTAKQAWKKAVVEVNPQTALQDKDRQVLLELGYNLGQSNSEGQVRHLKLARNNLDNLHQEAIDERDKKVKMWRYLGVLGGLLIAILLL